MDLKKLVLLFVLVDFAALTAWVSWDVGLAGLLTAATADAGSVLLTVDLVISLSLCAAWLWGDARRSGANPLPYLALTVLAGSVGPLLYLVRRRAA